jgi:hypothetical protein
MGVRYLSALMLALFGPLGGYPFGVVVWGWESLLISIIMVAGGAAIVWTLLTYFGMRPPPYVVHIFWIVVAVVLGVLAIRLIFSVA